VATSDITAALLFEAKVTGIVKGDAIHLQLRDKAKYLVNISNAEVSVPRKNTIGGFGKGNFKLVKHTDPAPKSGVEFRLTDQDTLIIIGGAVRRLGDVVMEERKKKPMAEVCYHKIKIDEGDPSKLTLEQTHKVFFVPTNEATDQIKDTNIAAKEPDSTKWNTEATALVWGARWVTKGLQAIAPKLITIVDMTLSPGSAALLAPK